MVTIRSPFCGYNLELMGGDLRRYSNKISPVCLTKCPHDHQPSDKAYLSDIRVTNISKCFTYKMAAKTTGIYMERNYVTVTVCI